MLLTADDTICGSVRTGKSMSRQMWKAFFADDKLAGMGMA